MLARRPWQVLQRRRPSAQPVLLQQRPPLLLERLQPLALQQPPPLLLGRLETLVLRQALTKPLSMLK